MSVATTAARYHYEWLTLADRNLDNELKSSVFRSLLSKYINLLVDISTTLRPEAAKLIPQIDS